MKWGHKWGLGFPWGIKSGSGPEEACANARESVLSQMSDIATPPGNQNLRDLVCKLAEGHGHFRDVLNDILLAFDIDTAFGEQLEILGSVIGLPRNGFADPRYRVFLKIQAELLLAAASDEKARTGSIVNGLNIARTFIGDAVALPVVYLGGLFDYILTVPGVATVAEMQLLARFLCIATDMGVLGQIIFILPGGQVWDTTHPPGPLPGGGIWNTSHPVVVAGGGIWSLTIGIGNEPCE